MGDAVAMPSTDSRPVAHWRARVPWVLMATTFTLVALMVPLSWGHEPWFDTVFYALIALTLATMGALVATRMPDNPIGWIFCVQGFWTGLLEMWGEGLDYHGVATATVGHWIIDWWWVLDLAAYALVFLLFPTGHLLSRRWRSITWLLGAGVLVTAPTQGLTARNETNPLQVDSPIIDALVVVGMVLLLAGVAAAAASLVVRFRRAAGQERLQLKLFVFAAVAIIPPLALAIPYYYVSPIVQAGVGLSFLVLPVAVGLAVLRYRLYDIDVVINRTLVYGALTALLAGIYLGSVLLLQLALEPFTEGSSLAVAVSTLAVAGLFRPARTRIQTVVDQRFFRSKYDSGRTLEQFGAHLRDQVDLAGIGTDLLAVVGDTVQPAHASLWLRKPEGRR